MDNKLIYAGRRTPSVTVLVTDEDTKQTRFLTLGPSLAIRNHSPDGFNWGYGGSGPSQLSLALLHDAIGNTPIEKRPSPETAAMLAERWYQHFKNDHVSNWVEDTFRISRAEIMAWLRQVVSQAQVKRDQYTAEMKWPKDTQGGSTTLGA